MKKKPNKKFTAIFEKFSAKVTKATGSPWAFIIAMLVILVWAISGPIFNYSDTWQLVDPGGPDLHATYSWRNPLRHVN